MKMIGILRPIQTQSAVLELTSFLISTVFLETVMCKKITINICGDSTCGNYYRQIEAAESIAEKLMENLFNGSSSFSMNHKVDVPPFAATDITFFKTDNDSTFFKCWDQANISNVTCERQTMDQCKLKLSNESCCSHRNAILWNTSSEFLYSPEIRNFTVKCGNETNKLIFFVYELVHTSSSSTTPLTTSTHEKSEEVNNTGLIIGIIVAVILVAVLAIIGFIIWKKRKHIKDSNSKSALNASSPGNYENTSQRNVPNLYNVHTSVNVLPANKNNGRPIPSKPQIDFDHQPGNTKSNYSNTEYTDPVEGNYTGIVYDVPKPQYSSNDQDIDKIEYYSSNEEVQQRIDDYTTIDSPDVQVGDYKTTDQCDDLLMDYSTIADAVVQQENSQNDNLIVREPNEIATVAKNPYSVLGNNDKNITDPYNELPAEPDMSSAYFVLFSEGELPQYSMAQNVSGDDGDGDHVGDGDNCGDDENVKNEASTMEQ
ncbi:unnamed protein product [Lymnaea stagnalis]|uniref:Uncharacterized protein n=1 Tax=Lymnaea stagnalis TaxID=6523 RepID=A0AAV2I1I4_LYMST